MSDSCNKRVIIVGAGIGGLTLSIFLQRKGWLVDIYEKQPRLADVHGAIYIQSNGAKVLSLIDVLPELIPQGAVITHLEHTNWGASPPRLISCPLYGEVSKASGGYPALGIRRSLLQKILHEHALKLGVSFHFGKPVVQVHQIEDTAAVEFADGTRATASFIIACDGLHSAIRRAVFGDEKAIYTGMTQVASIAPTPKGFGELYAYREFYSPTGEHAMFCNVSDTHSLFACTLVEGVETKESWGPMTPEELKTWQAETPFSKWGGGVSECILGAERVVKYGLYDRPPLQTWHSGRVLLIGDAAHPTSPHLGQGGNQAMEDVYQVMRFLPVPPEDGPVSTAALDSAFAQVEKVRISRSADFVAGARTKGEDRVQADPVKIQHRDAKLRSMWDDPDATLAQWKKVSQHPFDRTSEVVV